MKSLLRNPKDKRKAIIVLIVCMVLSGVYSALGQSPIRFFPDSVPAPVRIRIPVIDEKDALPLGLMFIAGFADGTAESLKHNYKGMSRKWHWDDDQYWDPGKSWTNKYKNHDPAQGEAFFGSKTFLVWTTDGYHMTRMVRNQCVVAAIVLNIGEKKVWWKYPLEAVFYMLSYSIGFNLAYEVIWK